jgi:hypothetical protein
MGARPGPWTLDVRDAARTARPWAAALGRRNELCVLRGPDA